MTQTEHRDHTFRCDHCGKKITAWITRDEDIPGTEEYHKVECQQGPVHQMVDFDVSLAEQGNAACGDTVGAETHHNTQQRHVQGLPGANRRTATQGIPGARILARERGAHPGAGERADSAGKDLDRTATGMKNGKSPAESIR